MSRCPGFGSREDTCHAPASSIVWCPQCSAARLMFVVERFRLIGSRVAAGLARM